MSVNSSLDSSFSLTVSAFTITRAVLLPPVSILILYLGHQRWRQQRSFTTSHSDFFTFHQAVMELIWVLGQSLAVCGAYSGLPETERVGIYLGIIVYYGPSFFQILTCLESYLAVVHPITYLRLRQSGGVRIRNICTGCVWLLSFLWIGVAVLYAPEMPIVPFIIFLIFSLTVVSFCGISVLCVLIRPGPGEVGGKKERVDQSKQRAFHTIMVILGVLWLWFLGLVVCLAFYSSPLLSKTQKNLVMASVGWFSVPNSLALPLLFLHRAGKLPVCIASPLEAVNVFTKSHGSPSVQ